MRVLGLVVMKPAGQSAHLNEARPFESEFTIAVEELKNVPGKQQKDKPLLPLKSLLTMGDSAQIFLHQV